MARDYLERQGYRIIACNHRCEGGEVDIVAWQGEVLCFVEVRARTNVDYGEPLETIDARKRSRIARAARDFLQSWRGAWPEMRFDAVGIVLGEPPEITLVQDAFDVTGT